MQSFILNVLIAIVSVLSRIITKLTTDTDTVETVNLIDVEYEFVTNGQLDFFAVLDEVIEVTPVTTVVEVTEVTEVQFDYSTIIAALGLVAEAPAVEVEVEVVAPVVAPVEDMTVTVLGIEYAIRHMTNVDVSFSGRSISRFYNVEGYLFQGSNGTSDFLIRVQAPLSISHAREWMSRNGETKWYNTKVVVTPTVTKFI